MQKALSNIVRFIKLSKGSDLSIYDEDFLQHTFNKRIKETELQSISDYHHFIKDHPKEAERLIQSFNITYSEFFRDPLVFALLWKWIFPSIFNQKVSAEKKEIRIWSAASASGQEAYSLAMLMDDLRMQYRKEITIQIFASDICSTEIEKAKAGFYPEDQIQKVPFKYLNEYFYPVDGGYKLIPRLRESVDFFTYDLLNAQTTSPPESIYGSFDLIYCSNLFIYYNISIRKKIIQKLNNNLVDGGLLITGDSERDILVLADDNLHEICPPASIFQKRYGNEKLLPPDCNITKPDNKSQPFC